MKSKIKTAKIFKSAFVFILLICLIASSVPIAFAAEQDIGVLSVEVQDLEYIQYTNGYWDTDYNYETDDWDLEYYRYYILDPSFTVTLKDGTVLESEYGCVTYDGEDYYLDFTYDQSYENQWGLGAHTVTAEFMGCETTFNVNIIESPISKIEVSDVEIIQYSSGDWDTDYNYETEEWDLEYYRYYYNPKFKITFKDGSVEECWGGFEYNGEYYFLDSYDDQSYENQWGLGVHTATAEFMGLEASFNVNIIDTPISKIEISDVEIIQYTNREECYDEEYDDYYSRYTYGPDYKITFKDGSFKEVKDSYFEYNGEYCDIDYTDDQSYENQWGLGSHKVTAEVLGYETSFNVNIVESPYESFEILEVKPLEESASRDYDIPWFKYKVTKKDGSSFVDMYMGYDEYDENLSIEEGYWDLFDSWAVGQDNSFKAYYAGLEATVNVEIIPGSGYEYIEQNGGLYITNVKDLKEDIEIPSEINGKKVIGITSFGNATKSVKNLTIPDTVKNIGEEALRWCSNLKTLTIGGGVNYLDADMFNRCTSLESITVSSANESYASVDGVVYNKAKDTLVVYPLGKGEDYNVPASVSNIDVLDSWQYADINVTFSDESKSYKTVDGVTYTADMTKVIRCNKDKSGEYIMPDSVTKISDKAFSECESLTEVKVSDNVTEIVYGAFENCTSLTKVSIPDTVTKIGEYAFNNCSSLSVADLPESLTEIEYSAFNSCQLSKIEIPDNVKTIGSNAFLSNGAEEVTIGKSVEEIGNYAFCSENMQTVVIPDNVKEIGTGVFSFCGNLKNVSIGNGISVIPDSLFMYCESLTGLTIPEGITGIGDSAFNCCGLTEIVLPKNVSYIGNGAFSYCESLNNLVIENDAVKIGTGAFSGCPLKNYTPDTNIAELGMYCFSGTDIESVNISKTVTEIAYSSFRGCENLDDINIPEEVIKIGGHSLDYTKWYNNQSDGEVYLDHIFYEYKGEMPENTEINIKNGTKTIADYALVNSTKLTSLTLPDGLRRIGGLAFYNCESITEINIPASVEDIGPYAFANCKSLTAVNVAPDNQYYTSVDGVLFNKAKTELIYCPKQESGTYSVPSSVKKIKAFAFDSECVSSITIANSSVELEEYAFGANLCRIALPESDSADADVRYSGVAVSCPKGSTTEAYANEHLIDILSYVDPVSEVSVGDVNGDTILDINDVTYLQKFLAGYSDSPIDITDSAQFAVANFNGDDVVDINDVTAIQMKLAGYGN